MGAYLCGACRSALVIHLSKDRQRAHPLCVCCCQPIAAKTLVEYEGQLMTPVEKARRVSGERPTENRMAVLTAFITAS
jgi:hypothetical protein